MRKEIRHVVELKEGGVRSGYTALIEDLHGLPEGKWSISIKKYIKSRSNAQNRLIHKYFDIIADETGDTLDRIKKILKAMFLTVAVLDDDGNAMTNPKTGEVLTYVKDTSDLDTIEMSEFTEKVRMFALDFNIILPLPEEMRTINFK